MKEEEEILYSIDEACEMEGSQKLEERKGSHRLRHAKGRRDRHREGREAWRRGKEIDEGG